MLNDSNAAISNNRFLYLYSNIYSAQRPLISYFDAHGDNYYECLECNKSGFTYLRRNNSAYPVSGENMFDLSKPIYCWADLHTALISMRKESSSNNWSIGGRLSCSYKSLYIFMPFKWAERLLGLSVGAVYRDLRARREDRSAWA